MNLPDREWKLIEAALKESAGNQTKAADTLCITLRYRLKKHKF